MTLFDRTTEKRIDYAVSLNIIPMLVPGLQEKDDVLVLALKIYLDIAAFGEYTSFNTLFKGKMY